MQEIFIVKLNEYNLKDILFNYYKINVEETKAKFEIQIGTNGKSRELFFKITQQKKINSLPVEYQSVLKQEDINKIINFEVEDKGYEVGNVNYEFDHNSRDELILDYIELKLKRKEKVKTKKRGWKRNV